MAYITERDRDFPQEDGQERPWNPQVQGAINAVQSANPPPQGATPDRGGPSGFVGFDRYFAANAGQANKDAAKVVGSTGLLDASIEGQRDVGAAAQKAAERTFGAEQSGAKDVWEVNPNEAVGERVNEAKQARDNLNTFEGFQSYFQGTGATPGMSRFDAGLAQRAGQSKLQTADAAFKQYQDTLANKDQLRAAALNRLRNPDPAKRFDEQDDEDQSGGLSLFGWKDR